MLVPLHAKTKRQLVHSSQAIHPSDTIIIIHIQKLKMCLFAVSSLLYRNRAFFVCVNSEKNILIERDIYVQIYKNFFVCMFIYLLIKACNVFLFSSVSIIWPIAVWSSFFQHVRLFKICPGSHPSLLKSSLPFDLLSNFPLVSLKKYHNIIMDVCLPSL